MNETDQVHFKHKPKCANGDVTHPPDFGIPSMFTNSGLIYNILLVRFIIPSMLTFVLHRTVYGQCWQPCMINRSKTYFEFTDYEQNCKGSKNRQNQQFVSNSHLNLLTCL